MLRLPKEAPVRLALAEAEVKTKKPRGGQTKTWHSQMKEDLEKISVPYNLKEDFAADRSKWNLQIQPCMM